MIDITKAATVLIGRRGEHHFRNITFDVSGLLGDEYPGAALNAIFKRPDGTAYPVVTNYADGALTWSPSATDTVDAGVGRLEIRVVHGDVIGKSVSVLTIIETALDNGDTAPPEPPAQEWVNQVLIKLAEIDVDGQLALLQQILSLIGAPEDYWGANKTILGYANTADNHTHSQSLCYPTLSDGVQINSGSTAWELGPITEVIPAGYIPGAYDLHWVNFETASGNGVYELQLFTGAPGEETLVAQVRTVRDNTQYGISSVPVQMPIQPPGTRLSARLAANNNNRNVTLSVYYHKYGED
jgi:hypothetical protein